MQVAYSGNAGAAPNYRCYRGRQLYATTTTCQTLGGRGVENHVLAEVFAVLEPANLTATIEALDQAEARHEQRVAAFDLAAERARYEAERARRQLDAVEPENRLVARTLERGWEETLAEQRRAETDLAAQRARRPVTLTDDEISGSTGPVLTSERSSKPTPPPTANANNYYASSSMRSSSPSTGNRRCRSRARP